MTEFDRITTTAPAWLDSVYSKAQPGGRTYTKAYVNGRTITPAELAELIEAADRVKDEDIEIYVVYQNFEEGDE